MNEPVKTTSRRDLRRLAGAALSHTERLLFPPRCACCRRVVGHSDLLCGDCAAALPRIEGEICPVCGVPKPFCDGRHAAEYRRAVAPFYYVGGVRQGLQQLKFYGHRRAAAWFGREMAAAVRRRLNGVRLDAVTCVPLTDAARRERGYNQAALLAREMAAALELPFDGEALFKLFETRPQHRLTREERQGNVLGVFEAEPDRVRGKTMLLVDDIRTTGSTLNECAKMLVLRGAWDVYAVTAAVTLRPEDEKRLTAGREAPLG